MNNDNKCTCVEETDQHDIFCPRCTKIVTPSNNDKEGWEKKAAKIALDAHKESKHYAKFSEVIYQGIKDLLAKRDEELREKVEKLLGKRVEYITADKKLNTEFDIALSAVLALLPNSTSK